MTKAFKKKWQKTAPFGRSTGATLLTFKDGGKMVIVGKVPTSDKADFWYRLYDGRECVKRRYSYDDIQCAERIVVVITAEEWDGR